MYTISANHSSERPPSVCTVPGRSGALVPSREEEVARLVGEQARQGGVEGGNRVEEAERACGKGQVVVLHERADAVH